MKPIYTIIICLLLSSCAVKQESVQTAKLYTIGFSQCTSDMWRQIMMIQMEAELTKYPNLKLIIKEAHNDSKLQIKQIGELIDAGVDLLIVSPNESEPITPIVAQAYRDGIPTIIWDRKIESDEYTSYISADNYLIGCDVGHYVHSILPKGSNILEIVGLVGSSPAQERHKGFIDIVNGDYHIKQIYGNWKPEVAKARVEDLGNYSDIDLVFAHNDDMAIAAYEAIAARDSLAAKRIVFVGIDAIVGMEAVVDGRLKATFLYPPGGELVVNTAVKILNGTQVDKNYTLQSLLVDSSNVLALKGQTETLVANQNHINNQRRDLDRMTDSFSLIRRSVTALAIVLVIMAIVVASLVYINFRVRKSNKKLSKRNAEVEQHTDELVAMNAKIESLTNQKLQFFTNLSHEIRTPLTLILNPLDKISKTERDPAIQKDIWTIQRNAKHLLKIVNQILNFQKIENDKMSLKLREVDIVLFTNEILKYFEAYAESEKIVYKFTSELKQQLLWIDTDKIEQALINLISNAFKNSKRYGIITVSITDNENSVIIEVHDTGCGMTKDTQQHIFDRFYSVDSSQVKHGIGIGLHLTKEFVEMHKGRISVDSELNKYTSFFIELQKGREHFDEDAIFEQSSKIVEENSEELDKSAKEMLSRRYPDTTILVAEDEEEIRSYLVSELSANFTVLSAANGYEAMQTILDSNVNIVLSDVLMPQINGFQLCKNIKTNVATSHIPVILLTALTDDSQSIYGIAEGADEYIRKPFNINYVKVKIMRMIDERRQALDSFRREFNAERFLDVDIKKITCADDIFKEKLFDLLELNYERSEFSIEELSSEIGISRAQLFRKTKSIFGLSPNDLLRSFRLKKAMLLLKQGGLTVSEVTYSVGFTTPAYFSKCFKEEFGITPNSVKA